jgi:ribose-phosphate pyrophosphokinase
MLKVIICPSAKYFGEKIVAHLSKTLDQESIQIEVKWTTFKNGELKAELLESVRGNEIFIIQDVSNTIKSIHDNIFELFIAIDACKHSAAKSISLVLPTFPYARQHRKSGREGLSAKMFSQFLETFHIDRIITLDLHNRELENAFNDIIIENLHASYQIIKMLLPQLKKADSICVVAPDTGAAERNKFFARILKADYAIIYKERDYERVSDSVKDSNIISMKVLGDIKGKDCFLFDDIVDTGGTVLKAAKLLKNEGAETVTIGVSLPFFSGTAREDFTKAHDNGDFNYVIGTNAVFNENLWKEPWFLSAPIDKLFADIITRIVTHNPISELLDSKYIIQKLLSKNKII